MSVPPSHDQGPYCVASLSLPGRPARVQLACPPSPPVSACWVSPGTEPHKKQEA